MKEKCEFDWYWMIIIIILMLGAFSDHTELRNAQRRIAVLEQKVK